MKQIETTIQSIKYAKVYQGIRIEFSKWSDLRANCTIFAEKSKLCVTMTGERRNEKFVHKHRTAHARTHNTHMHKARLAYCREKDHMKSVGKT